MNITRRYRLKHVLLGVLLAVSLCLQLSPVIPAGHAQVFDGGGVDAGLDQAAGVTGVATGNPRMVVVRVLATILNFLGLIATIMIIIAGFYLVLSLGNEESKEKAKKIILYTLIGLFIILVSRIIVSIITKWIASQV
jgi:hypothetical protein